MKGVIIYKSRYGSTRQYAEWVREATGFELYEVGNAPADLRVYDLIVIASSVLAGRLVLANWIRRQWPSICEKSVCVLLNGVLADAETAATVIAASLPEEIAQHLHVFPVRGRYVLREMSFFHRTLIKFVASLEKDPEKKQGLLAEQDYVDKDNLDDLLAFIHSAREG